MSKKFFVDIGQIAEATIIIKGQDVNHIKNVLRYNIGDNITICDGIGNDYKCTIEEFHDDSIVLNINTKLSAETEPNVKITLFQALPKADKMEWVIQKCTELGIHQIVPMTTDRVVVKIDSKKASKKITRWNKIAEAASKQSGRGVVPKVTDIITYKQAIAMANTMDKAIIAYEKEDNQRLKDTLRTCDIESIGIFIGPEGGYTEDEIQLALDNAVESVSLGKRILRAETASIALTTMIMYELDEI